MKKMVGKLIAIAALLFAGTLYADCGLHQHAPAIKDAWIREAPPVAKVMAGFMKIDNSTAKPMVLQGAESSLFEKVEIHRTVMEGGMARMERQAGVTVPAHGQLEFSPGGLHLMLVNPKQRLKAGDTVSITLEFEGGKSSPVVFTIRPLDNTEQHHHHH